MAAFGVNRAAHVGCISDTGHNGASKIQRRVRQVDPSPSPMPMCGLGLIVCAPERKVIRVSISRQISLASRCLPLSPGSSPFALLDFN